MFFFFWKFIRLCSCTFLAILRKWIISKVFTHFWRSLYIYMYCMNMQASTYIRGVIKNNRYFKISWAMYVRFSLFFFSNILLHMSVSYVDNISHFALSVCFRQIKRLIVFWCALRFFFLFKKMSQRNCIKFCVRN